MKEDLKIKMLSENDVESFKKLISLFRDVFEHENNIQPSNSYLKKLLNRPGFTAIVVMNDQEIIGGLTAYEIEKYYSETSEFFIYDIAVKPEFQRKGFGKALMSRLKRSSAKRGIHEIFVAAHEEDVEALQFYENMGGEKEKVVHFNYYS